MSPPCQRAAAPYYGFAKRAGQGCLLFEVTNGLRRRLARNPAGFSIRCPMRGIAFLLVAAFLSGCANHEASPLGHVTANSTAGGSGASVGATGGPDSSTGSLSAGQSGAGGGTGGTQGTVGQTGGTEASGSGSGGTIAGNATAGTNAGQTGGATGGATTGTTGGLGKCQGPPPGLSCGTAGASCGCDTDCCAGEGCDRGYCRLPLDAGCIGSSDCATEICQQDRCACAYGGGFCASASDCCGSIACERTLNNGQISGTCCNPIGGQCEYNVDCCDDNCQFGKCACIPINAGYYGSCGSDADCCTGSCIGGGCCQSGGGECQTDGDCCLGNCNGVSCACSSQAFSSCNTKQDCCGVLGCALTTGGTRECCLANGATSQSPNDCCSGNWDGASCACLANGTYCSFAESCCDGGICAIPDSGYYTVCCQDVGQKCHFGNECCSGVCAQGSCM